MKHLKFTLAALTLCFAVLTSARIIGERGIWYDESISLLELSNHSWPKWSSEPLPARTHAEKFSGSTDVKTLLHDLRTRDIHPPVYYVIALQWQNAWNSSLESLRALSFIFYLLALIVLWSWARRRTFSVPASSALLLVSLYGASSAAVYFGSEARNTGLGILLVLAGSLCLIEARGRWSYSIAGGLFCAFALLTTYLTALPCAYLVAWNGFAEYRSKGQAWLWRALTPAALMLLAAVLLIPWLSGQIGSRAEEAPGYPGILTELYQYGRSMTILLIGHTDSRWTLPIFLLLMFVMACAFRYPKDSEQRRLALFFLGLLIVPLVQLHVLNALFDKNISSFGHDTLALLGLVPLLWLGLENIFAQAPKTGLLISSTLLISMSVASAAILERGAPFYYFGLTRQISQRICATKAPKALAVVDASYGRGDAGQWIYELQCDIDVSALKQWQTLDRLPESFNSYSEIWAIVSWEDHPRNHRASRLNQLLAQAGYKLTDSLDHDRVLKWSK